MHFNKITLLTSALIIFLLGHPLVDAFDIPGGPWLIIFSTIIPATAIYAIGFTGHRLEIALSIGVPFIIVSWLHAIENFILWDVAYSILAIIFYIYVLGILIYRLIKAETANNVLLLGSVSTYLLLGVFWSEVYRILEYMIPGSFAFAYFWEDFLYYSFGTLTTLGIGDIIPLSSMAKSLTILEAIAGVLFVATLISRIVGVYVSQTTKREVKAVTENIIEEKPIKKSIKKLVKSRPIKKIAKKPKKKIAKKKSGVKKAVKKKVVKK